MLTDEMMQDMTEDVLNQTLEMSTTANSMQRNVNTSRLERYTEAERTKIMELTKQIPIGDSQAVMMYGTTAQDKLSGFSDQMLSSVKQKEIGEVGEVLGSLMSKLGEVQLKDFQEDKGFLGKLIGKTKRKTQNMMSKYQTVNVQVDQISYQLDLSKQGLLSDVAVMDNMYEQNIQYLKGIDLYITAGDIKLDEIQNVLLPELQARANQSNDALLHQQLLDLTQFHDRLDKRMHDLKLTKQIIEQTGPQIRMIQATSQTLAEKIQSSIMTAIPLWKNQITIALTLQTQARAIASQKLVTETTNNLLLKNSEMLKINTVETAKENERGIIEIETLKKTQENLISTIEETMKIQSDGREKRKQAEGEIAKLEKEMKERMLKIHMGIPQSKSFDGATVDMKNPFIGERSSVNYMDM